MSNFGMHVFKKWYFLKPAFQNWFTLFNVFNFLCNQCFYKYTHYKDKFVLKCEWQRLKDLSQSFQTLVFLKPFQNWFTLFIFLKCFFCYYILNNYLIIQKLPPIKTLNEYLYSIIVYIITNSLIHEFKNFYFKINLD